MPIPSFLLGLIIAAFSAFLVSLRVPQLLASLTAPPCAMHACNGKESSSSAIQQSINLFSVYVGLAFVCATTGGGISQLLQLNRLVQPTTALFLGAASGLLLVAVARITAIGRDTSLAGYLQGFLVGTPASVVFLLFADPDLLTLISDSVKKALPDFSLFVLVGSVGVFCLVELLHIRGGTREVPFSLARQRIEQWERVDQIWGPRKVTPATLHLIRSMLKGDGHKSISWLTSTCPMDNLRLIETFLWEQINHNMPEPALQEHVRIIVPLSSWQHVSEMIEPNNPILRFIRLLPSDGTPRLRLLILNSSVAVIHLPIPHNSLDPDESSNYACVLRELPRVLEHKAMFDRIWDVCSPPKRDP